MGLFSRKFSHPIRGTATVASATACPSHASSANCRMNLVVSLPGVPATPVERTMMVRADKWPMPGSVLPVEVDADKPSRMRVLWDEVPSGRARGTQAAQHIADMLNGTVPGGAAMPQAGLPGTAPAGASPTSAAAPGVLPAGAFQLPPGAFQIPPGAYVVNRSTTINGQPASAEQIAAVESMIGMDLNGDGVIGGPPASQ